MDGSIKSCFVQFEVPGGVLVKGEGWERREGVDTDLCPETHECVLVERQPCLVRITVLYQIFSFDFQPGKVSTDSTVNHFLMGHVVSTGNEDENPWRENH